MELTNAATAISFFSSFYSQNVIFNAFLCKIKIVMKKVFKSIKSQSKNTNVSIFCQEQYESCDNGH